MMSSVPVTADVLSVLQSIAEAIYAVYRIVINSIENLYNGFAYLISSATFLSGFGDYLPMPLFIIFGLLIVLAVWTVVKELL